MLIRRMTMNSNSGKVMYLKFTVYSYSENNNGNKAIIKRIMTNIALNAIIRYLNFNGNTPIMNIKERLSYVNDAEALFPGGGWNE
jgi:hypothetical protein